MRETTLSSIERNFILKAVDERKRLDGRQFNARRGLNIHFSKDWGCCQVSLGETRVLAQVSCEIQQPKSTRANEGLLFINIEFSPMAAAHFEPGRPSELCVQTSRLLEKCIKESRCVDMESLCIVAEEKVWAIRLDLTVLNHEGNIVECASIAALAALSHFKRPDVTSTGDGIIIHSASEKDPLPITLHHFPLCLSYAIFHKGRHILADPTELEERVSEASLVVGMNGYHELCGLHLGGSAITNHNAIIQCVKKAGVSAVDIIKLIKQSLQDDEDARSRGEEPGFAASLRAGKITFLAHECIKVRLDTQELREAARSLVRKSMKNKRTTFDDDGNPIEESGSSDEEQVVVSLGEHSAELKAKSVPPDTLDSDVEVMDASSGDEKSASEECDEEGEKNVSSLKGENINSPKEGRKKRKPKKKVNKAAFKHDSSDDDSQNSDPADDVEVIAELSKEDKEKMKQIEEYVVGDSEEEETTTLTSVQIEKPDSSVLSSTSDSKNKKPKKKRLRQKQEKSRGWYPGHANF